MILDNTISRQADAARISDLQLKIQKLERDKQQVATLIIEQQAADKAKDAQMQQLTNWCRQLSAANQTLLQDKAGMLQQTKQVTEWCQQLIHSNQMLQQEKAQLVEQHKQQNSGSEARQREVDELLRQKSILIEYASGQARQIEHVSQTNAQLLALNQDLEQKLRAIMDV